MIFNTNFRRFSAGIFIFSFFHSIFCLANPENTALPGSRKKSLNLEGETIEGLDKHPNGMGDIFGKNNLNKGRHLYWVKKDFHGETRRTIQTISRQP